MRLIRLPVMVAHRTNLKDAPMRFAGLVLAGCLYATVTMAQTLPPMEFRVNSTVARQLVKEKSMPAWTTEIENIARYKPSELEAQHWALLDQGMNYETGNYAALSLATAPTSKEMVPWSLNWLRKQVLSPKADARVSYAYAHNLWLMHLATPQSTPHFKALALRFITNARFLAITETKQCEDKRTSTNLRVLYEAANSISGLFEESRKKTSREWAIDDLEVAGLQLVLGETRPNRNYLCSLFPYGNSGVDASVDPVANLRNSIESLMRDRP